MSRTCSYAHVLLVTLAIIRIGFSEPYEYVPADRGYAPEKSGTTILPQSFLREYDPVTVFFSDDRNKGKAGPEDHGEKYLKISPSHPGEYIWVDAKTLEFRPTVPWPPVSRFTVKADDEEKKLATILTPPTSISPSSGSSDLGKVREVTLEFAYPVDIEVLKKLVRFESTPLPGIDRSQSVFYTAADYSIKAGEQKPNGSVPYTFILPHPFALGHKIRTIVTLSDIADFSEGKRTYFFETKADFRLTRLGVYGNLLSVGASGNHYSVDNAMPIDNQGRIVLEFSSRPKSLSISQAKSLFTFSPTPQSFDYSQSGNRIVATVGLEPERLYKVTVQPIPLSDHSDRKLIMDGPSSFYCFRNPDKRYIRWSESFNIMETHGPQHMPMQVANIEAFDLRIYKIDPLNKVFWPFPGSPVSVNEGDLPPGPGEEPPLEKDIIRPVGSSELTHHIQMLGSPHFSSVIDTRKDGILTHQTIDLKPKLQAVGGKDKPGTYLIGFRELDGSTNRRYVKAQVTDLCLSSVQSKNEVLFVVTSYQTGKPVSNASVKIEGMRNKPSGNKFKTLYSTATDRQGMSVAPAGVFYIPDSLRYKEGNYQPRRIIVNKDNDYLVLDINGSNTPPLFVNNHWVSNRGGWLQTLSNEKYSFDRDREWKGFVFPERPIYRPGEKVYLKGYVRSIFQGKYDLPKGDTATLTVSGPDNSWNFPVRLSNLGTFDHVFSRENPATGRYRVSLSYDPPGSRFHRQTLAGAEFTIEAYRVPRFEVKLHGPDQVPNDQPFTMGLTASYYAGGRVIDCPVKWRVVTFPYSWHLSGWDGYCLSSDSRYSHSLSTSDRHSMDEENRTDENGAAKLTIQADAALGGNPTKYMVEATVTDVDEQTVTDVRSIVALPPFVLALKTDRYVTNGSDIKAQLAAVDVNEKAIAGQKVTVTLKKMTWHHYLQETDFARSEPEYITKENVTVIEEREITTAREPVEVVFENHEPGVYILDLSSKDKLGRLQTLQVDMFLAGDKPVVWEKSEQKVFETVTDKDAYVPGDRAQIILKSPYQSAMALAVTEMPDGNPDYEWITVSKGQATFTLDITAEMINRIPVSFLLMRKRVVDAKRMPEGHFVDVGKPKTDANTTWLTVKPTANRVSISLEHEKVQIPGDTMLVDVSLTDWKGNPVSGEVTFWLVDEAVLALGEEMNLDPLPSFIPSVSSHIRMRDSRNMARGMISDFESPGGGGEGIDDELMEEPINITVRKNFKTVPYYNPDVLIDNTGKKRLAIPLPDNLTRFAIRAVAISGAERFGLAKSRVSLRLPVIVQPALPRFVRIGDRFKAGGVTRIVEGEGGKGRFTFEADGLKILSGQDSDRWHQFTFPGKKAHPLFIDMEVESPGYNEELRLKRDSISFLMAVRKAGDNKGDAFSVKIPLRPDRHPVKREFIALVKRDSSFVFPSTPEVRPHTLMRRLLVYDELPLLKVLAGLRYLMEYPHGSIEHKVSRAYPSLAYQDVWRQVGIEPPDPRLNQYVNETLEFLVKCQDDNGLFAYWPGDTGRVYLTAYVVEFMSVVKSSNTNNSYAFPRSSFKRACDALERSLRSDYSRFLSSYKYYERCAAIYALVKAGRVDRSYLKQLAYHSEQTDILSQSRIYSAIIESGKNLNRVLKDLEEELWSHTVFRLRDGKEVYAGLQSGSNRIGAQVHLSEIGHLAGLVGALSKRSSSPGKVEMLTDELITLGSDEGWGNTHNNSLALLALRERMITKKDSRKTATLLLSHGTNREYLDYEESKGVLTHNFTATDSGTISLSPGESFDSMYVRLSERYLPAALGSQAPSAQQGFVVKRRLIFPDSAGPSQKFWIDSAGQSFRIDAGSIIEEHIQVTNPENRHFVAVVIPLAAGFEYLNPELKTSSSESEPEGRTTNEGNYQAFYDDKIVYYFNSMRKGNYDFYFRVRATTEGTFSQPPAYAEMMYEEEIRGNSPGTQIVVVGEQ